MLSQTFQYDLSKACTCAFWHDRSSSLSFSPRVSGEGPAPLSGQNESKQKNKKVDPLKPVPADTASVFYTVFPVPMKGITVPVRAVCSGALQGADPAAGSSYLDRSVFLTHRSGDGFC